MHVHLLALTGVLSHQDTKLEFPDAGVVCVTGPNGAGKSSIIEGVAVALWGKTLRGTSPWNPGSDRCQAFIVTSLVSAARWRKGGKSKLSWQPTDVDMQHAFEVAEELDGPTFETVSKAQPELDKVLPPFDVWRRAAVFSSADASYFTLASDAERKRLVEAVLGLDRFDAAVERCRVDLKRAVRSRDDARRRVDVARAGADAAGRELARLRAVFAAESVPDPGPLPPGRSAQELLGMARRASVEAAEVERQLWGADQRASSSLRQAKALRAEAAATRAQGACTACGRAAPPEEVERLASAAEHRAEVDERAAEVAREQSREFRATLDELRAEAQELERLYRERLEREQARLTADHVATTRRKVEQAIVVAEAELAAREADVDDHTTAAEVAALDAAELEQVERVLGLGGVRARVLDDALAAVAANANAWLARLAPPQLIVDLSVPAESARGAVAIEIGGAGAGLGYRASSAGERRRVDVGLLLGLGQVAAAAAGAQPGTLFFDEVFDHLDADGRAAAVEMIEELAVGRCCVVISHDPELIAGFRGAPVWRVEGGRVTC